MVHLVFFMQMLLNKIAPQPSCDPFGYLKYLAIVLIKHPLIFVIESTLGRFEIFKFIKKSGQPI